MEILVQKYKEQNKVAIKIVYVFLMEIDIKWLYYFIPWDTCRRGLLQ